MKKKPLDGIHIAILATNGFEESEMIEPRKALLNAGADVSLITLQDKQIKSWTKGNWGKNFTVDKLIKNVKPKDFDGLLLPGGVMNPDTLRKDKKAIQFVKYFIKNKKPIAAICHGPWLLIETGKLNGFTLTSYKSIKSDLVNAGAKWVDKEVVISKNILTSRSPKDLPAFNKAVVKLFG